MKIPLYQVDAFTGEVFKGNPAAVCILESWLDDAVLQNMAAENNLSETAFLVRRSAGAYDLRWFTPAVEVDLCGHATLGSAHVIFEFMEKDLTGVSFQTASGELSVVRSGDLLAMDFPARKPLPYDPPPGLSRALGRKASTVLKSRDLMVVFENEAHVRDMQPDYERLLQMDDIFAVIVTAPGDASDFVSRFFAPGAGIPEDPVTGSAHCTLVPYWAERLKKNRLHAFQLSKRGGELFCEYLGDRVKICGQAVLYAKGEICL